MSDARPDASSERAAQEAAAWVLRCDRGLTATEQDEFSAWLAADRRHGAQLARHRQHWQRLDRLGQWGPEHSELPNPDLLAPPLRRLRFVLPVSLALAAAAALAVVFFMRESADSKAPAATVAATTPANVRVLDDGTRVELNGDAAFTAQFSPAERRVRLDHGEAHFFVTPDVTRPFVVSAGGIDVRAVGTAFNVRLASAVVEVLVTEGKVQLAAPAIDATTPPAPLVPVLEARQRVVVPRLADVAATPQIATLTAGEIERVLAWQHRLIDLNATPLAEIVAEFNRRNPTQLLVLDPELASVRIGGAMRSDNVAGFVRLLETGFGVRAERHGDAEIVLRRKR